jgi:hypothetical protein
VAKRSRNAIDTEEGGYQTARHCRQHFLAQRYGNVLVVFVWLAESNSMTVEPVVSLTVDC